MVRAATPGPRVPQWPFNCIESSTAMFHRGVFEPVCRCRCLYMYPPTSGLIPTEIGHLSALTQLHLSCNAFVGAYTHSTLMPEQAVGPCETSRPSTSSQQVCLCWALCVFHVRRSVGRLPTEIGLLTALTDLHVHTNQLTGACVLGPRTRPLCRRGWYTCDFVPAISRMHPNGGRPAPFAHKATT